MLLKDTARQVPSQHRLINNQEDRLIKLSGKGYRAVHGLLRDPFKTVGK